MSNIIDKIQVSGVTYDLPSGGSGSTTVELTQAEYDALVSGGTVDPNTYYIISDASPADMSNYWTSAQTNSAITQAVSGKVDTSSVVTAVTSGSTDSEIPTAKAVYDATQSGGGGGTTYSAGRGIDITNDTISFSLPISAGTGTNSIIGGDPHNTATNIGSIALGGWYNNYASYGLCNASGKGAVSLGGSATEEDSFTAAGTGIAEGKRSAVIASFGSKTKGTESFAIGRNTTANTFTSFAQGRYTKTTNEAEVALGEYNNSVSATTTFGDSGNTLFSVGNGTSNNARHNVFEIRQNGDIYITLNGQDVKLQDNLGGGSATIDPTLDSGSTNPVANSAITTAINAKQDTLVSGTNIKTINNQSILGSGNIEIQGSVTVDQTIISGSTNPVAGGAVYDALGGFKLLRITQAAYDALVQGGTVDPNTIYYIVN